LNFINETNAINGLADTIIKGGVCLYNSVKYLYSLADRDFYNIDVKDVFKVLLNNITDSESLASFGLRIDGETCAEMQNDEYNRVLPLIVYSLAVRVPTLKNAFVGEDSMSDDQIYKLYTAVMQKGAENYRDIIPETFLESKYLVRKGKPMPPFTAEWFKAYICNHVAPLSEISNKNIFLLGVADMLFAMFYPCFEEELRSKLADYVASRPVMDIEI
jgi:hypothetical protein